MNVIVYVLILFCALTIRCAEGEDGFFKTSKPSETIKRLCGAKEARWDFFQAALIPLDKLSASFGGGKACRWFLINDWNGGTIITIIEEDSEDGTGRYRIWFDVINSEKSVLRRNAKFSNIEKVRAFFQKTFSADKIPRAFFNEEFWENAEEGTVDAGRVIFEKLEKGEKYECVSVSPHGKQSKLLQDYLFELLDVLDEAGIDTSP